QTPIITPLQLRHWNWMASYYMCSLGVVVKAALPSAFLLESETIIKLVQGNVLEPDTLSDDEYLVYEALQQQSSIHINGIRAILDKKNVVSVIQKLIGKGIVEVEETIYEQYTPKLKRYIRLASEYDSEQQLRTLLENMGRAPKQREVLMTFFTLKSQSKKPIDALVLQKKSNASTSILKSLIDKEIFEEYFIQKDRVEYSGE